MAKYSSKSRKPTPKRKHRQNRVTTVLAVVAVLTAVLTASMAWGARAKYVHQSEREGVVRALAFYFTSDYLMPESDTAYTLNLTDAETASVTFELRNYDGLNVSELPVNYDVKISSGKATLTREEDDDGVIDITEKSARVTISGMKAGYSYTVVAKGSNGYEKTLYATFNVKSQANGIFYNVRDFGDYVLVTVWTEDATATELKIEGLTGFIPDETDKALTGCKTGQTVTHEANLGQFESRSYRFFKDGGDASAIVVTADKKAITKNTNLN